MSVNPLKRAFVPYEPARAPKRQRIAEQSSSSSALPFNYTAQIEPRDDEALFVLYGLDSKSCFLRNKEDFFQLRDQLQLLESYFVDYTHQDLFQIRNYLSIVLKKTTAYTTREAC